MTETHLSLTSTPDSGQAGRHLGGDIREAFNGAAPDAIVVFASAQHDYSLLLRELAEAAGTQVIVGSSSAGEFTHLGRGEGQVSAMGLRSDAMQFSVGLGRGVTEDPVAAAASVARSFKGPTQSTLPHRNALVMTDALAGHTDAIVEELTVQTGGSYRFFGGGAGDDGRFQKTHVFAGTQAHHNAVVALEILSAKPIGVGVAHGWTPTGLPMRVTEAQGSRLVSLNGAPAVEAFRQRAQELGQPFPADDPFPFFLHNVLGIQGTDGFRLRVPLGVDGEGAVLCAAAVPEGAIVHLMRSDTQSAVLAARQATRSALDALGGASPAAAFVFDCVATRLRLGHAFEDELAACSQMLSPAGFVGCNTYGQIARAEGQFGGFHNCTAVVCVLPQ